MRRLLGVLVLLIACSESESPPRNTGTPAVTARAMATGGDLPPLDTTPEVQTDTAVTATDTLIRIASRQWKVDTTIRIPIPPPVERGVPFGGIAADQEISVTEYSWTALSSGTPKILFDNLRWAHQRGLKSVTFNLPGGQHSSVGPNLSIIRDTLRYDSLKYFARVRAFDTQAVRDSLAKYCAIFRCEFNSIDEPHVVGGDDGAGTIVGNTWGPRGWMTKAKVDRQCQLIKSILPGYPVGPAGAPSLFYPEQPAYKYCDYIRAQYSQRMGERSAWLQLQRQSARGLPLTFSINIVNGGVQDRDGTWDCKQQGGVKGQRKPNCSMMPDTVRTLLLFFARRGNGSMAMWRNDDERMPRLLPAFRAVKAILDTTPYKPIPVRDTSNVAPIL